MIKIGSKAVVALGECVCDVKVCVWGCFFTDKSIMRSNFVSKIYLKKKLTDKIWLYMYFIFPKKIIVTHVRSLLSMTHLVCFLTITSVLTQLFLRKLLTAFLT